MSSEKVTLRRALPDDENFLLEVYASTRERELAMTNWNEAQRDAFVRMQFAAQQQHYQTYNPEGEHSIILLNDRPVGRIYTADKEDEIHILDITVLPAYRNAGIGTPLINDLLMRAKETGKPVRIYVDKYDRSLGLFARLGFGAIEDDGVNILLEYRPQS